MYLPLHLKEELLPEGGFRSAEIEMLFKLLIPCLLAKIMKVVKVKFADNLEKPVISSEVDIISKPE